MFFLRKAGWRFVRRYGIVTEDFTEEDFTLDNTVRSLDLSGIVPKNAKQVRLRISMSATSDGYVLSLGGVNSVGIADMCSFGTQVDNVTLRGMCELNTDTTGMITYTGVTGYITSIHVYVHGWWI